MQKSDRRVRCIEVAVAGRNGQLLGTWGCRPQRGIAMHLSKSSKEKRQTEILVRGKESIVHALVRRWCPARRRSCRCVRIRGLEKPKPHLGS